MDTPHVGERIQIRRPYSYEGHWVLMHAQRAAWEDLGRFFQVSTERIREIQADAEGAYIGEEWHQTPTELAEQLDAFFDTTDSGVGWGRGLPTRPQFFLWMEKLATYDYPYGREFQKRVPRSANALKRQDLWARAAKMLRKN